MKLTLEVVLCRDMGMKVGALGLNPDPLIMPWAWALGGLLLGDGFSGEGTGLPKKQTKYDIYCEQKASRKDPDHISGAPNDSQEAKKLVQSHPK